MSPALKKQNDGLRTGRVRLAPGRPKAVRPVQIRLFPLSASHPRPSRAHGLCVTRFNSVFQHVPGPDITRRIETPAAFSA